MDAKVMRRRDLFLPIFLSAFIVPGAGQLYNRDFRRGAVLIGLTLLYILTFAIGIGSEALRQLPPDMAAWDPETVRRVSENLRNSSSSFLNTFNWLMTITWVYAVLDAYWGARERFQPPVSDDSDEE
jgi:hypothetical protein